MTDLTTADQWLAEARDRYAAGDYDAAEAAACISAVTRHGEHEADAVARLERWRTEDQEQSERELADRADRDMRLVRAHVDAAVEVERRKREMREMFEETLGKIGRTCGESKDDR